MKTDYNPFTKDESVKTEHGVITFGTRRYFTHRRPEHYFKKFQGFGISVTELEVCYNEHVDNIVIKYHGKKKNIIYKIKLEMLKYFERYTNEGDEQVVIPIREMEVVGYEELKEHQEFKTNANDTRKP